MLTKFVISGSFFSRLLSFFQHLKVIKFSSIKQQQIYGSVILSRSRTSAILAHFFLDSRGISHVTSQNLKTTPIPRIKVGDAEVQHTSARNLGVIIDGQLTMREHVNNFCRNATLAIRSIGEIRYFLDQNTIEKLVLIRACHLAFGQLQLTSLWSRGLLNHEAAKSSEYLPRCSLRCYHLFSPPMKPRAGMNCTVLL